MIEILAEIDSNHEQIKWLHKLHNVNIMDFMYLMDCLLETRTRLFALLEEMEYA